MLTQVIYLLAFLAVAALAVYPLWLPKALQSLMKKKMLKVKLDGYLKLQYFSMVMNSLLHPAWEQMVLFVTGVTFARENFK